MTMIARTRTCPWSEPCFNLAQYGECLYSIPTTFKGNSPRSAPTFGFSISISTSGQCLDSKTEITSILPAITAQHTFPALTVEYSPGRPVRPLDSPVAVELHQMAQASATAGISIGSLPDQYKADSVPQPLAATPRW